MLVVQFSLLFFLDICLINALTLVFIVVNQLQQTPSFFTSLPSDSTPHSANHCNALFS